MLKIATWNVNSIRSRSEAVHTWLQHAKPDVVCLQETKCLTSQFPLEMWEEHGYHVACLGQKSYNGVAIASQQPLEEVVFGLETQPHAYHQHNAWMCDIDVHQFPDDSARYIEALTYSASRKPLRIASVYVPNGNPIASEKYTKKLQWLEALKTRSQHYQFDSTPFYIMGDFNIIPHPDDAAQPQNWVDDALFTPQVRHLYSSLLHAGYTDALASFKGRGCYTFWDYKARSFERNNGIRIDHILANPSGAMHLQDAGADKFIRTECEKPSDHIPVWAHITL